MHFENVTLTPARSAEEHGFYAESFGTPSLFLPASLAW